jgi:hypothetical protein
MISLRTLGFVLLALSWSMCCGGADDDGGCDAACQQRSNAKQMEQRLEDKNSADSTNSTIEIVGGFVGAAVLGFVYDKWCKKHCCCNDDDDDESTEVEMVEAAPAAVDNPVAVAS